MDRLLLCFSSFQSNKQNITKVEDGPGRVFDGGSSVANSVLVSGANGLVDKDSVDSSAGNSIPTAFEGETSTTQETNSNSVSLIRENLEMRKISRKASDIIMASWRPGTKQQYSSYIRKWISFTNKRKISAIQVPVDQVLEFMTELYGLGLGYSALNTARSSLSALGISCDGFVIGKHPLVIRFLKGMFNLRPSKPRYSKIWDVSCVLNVLRKLSPCKYLSLKDLSLKLCMLIALTTAARCQSLHLLSINGIEKSSNVYKLQYEGLLKQDRPGCHTKYLELKAYPPDRRLCVITVLKEYLKRTSIIRKDCKYLFVSYVKPHNRVCRDTLSRWLKTLMSKAGIDINEFSSHSIRSAAVSKAKYASVPIDDILKVAGWSNVGTFGKFYDKKIVESQFHSAVLT